MIRYIVDSLLESEVREIIVVTGFEENRIRSALKDRDIRFVSNPDYDQGMSTSLAAGLLAASGETDAVMICLADMPLVTRRGINLLIANHDPGACHEICLPTYQGKRGHPVLWSRRFIREMLQLEGDIGARQLLIRHEEVVHEVPMEDPGVVYDVDTPEAIEALQNRFE
jgi:molybdenum cofactor cytidylyltransferase